MPDWELHAEYIRHMDIEQPNTLAADRLPPLRPVTPERRLAPVKYKVNEFLVMFNAAPGGGGDFFCRIISEWDFQNNKGNSNPSVIRGEG